MYQQTVSIRDLPADRRHPEVDGLEHFLGLEQMALRTRSKLRARDLIVQKYGGSSVADAAAIKRVARRIAETREAGHPLVVVVSAMGDTTDELLDLAVSLSPSPPASELDALLTTGERISVTLLAIALSDLGVPSRTFSGKKAGLITDGIHGKAHIVNVDPHHIRACLKREEVAIVAGFQGKGLKKKEVTTLGRGGSDITAVALAAALGAGMCEIYTDVDGVYTADPRVVPRARKIDVISNEEMLELAASGSKVVHARCLEYARRFGVPIHVRSSFNRVMGTLILPSQDQEAVWDHKPVWERAPAVEQPVVSAVLCDRSVAKLKVIGVADGVGKSAEIFGLLADARAQVDMVVQNSSAARAGGSDISLAIPSRDGFRVREALSAAQGAIGFIDLQYDGQIGRLSLIGVGLRTDAQVFSRLFKALSDAGAEIELISASDMRIDVVVRAAALEDAQRSVRFAFGLDDAGKDPAGQEQAGQEQAGEEASKAP
ncbi:aspartate kinase [Arthrobacter sp. efr-133-R2A-120]|uniref:aspartate kinase n=1 Tax=Arthrobacter sp. efr-133-R2A-120 TaxID=3040277 RepID=UPI0033064320